MPDEKARGENLRSHLAGSFLPVHSQRQILMPVRLPVPYPVRVLYRRNSDGQLVSRDEHDADPGAHTREERVDPPEWRLMSEELPPISEPILVLLHGVSGSNLGRTRYLKAGWRVDEDTVTIVTYPGLSSAPLGSVYAWLPAPLPLLPGDAESEV